MGVKSCLLRKLRRTTLFHPTVFEAIIVEIIHGEGGDDSKFFVDTLADLYKKVCVRKNLQFDVLASDFGHVTIKVTGKLAEEVFRFEAGKHCVQRVPNNDKSGRKHTSFVTVAVLPLPPERVFSPLPAKDIEIKTQTGKQKAGGQNANKVASAVRARHVPTGLSVFINGRDQVFNKQQAIRILTARVNYAKNKELEQSYWKNKNSQLSDRGRGGKIRTYNFSENFITNHLTGKQTNDLKTFLKGNIDLV